MLNQTLNILRQGMAEGLHLGAQIFVSLNDEVLCDDAVGEARFGVAMTRDSINWWLSACKPVTAVAIAQLWERGRLDLDDRVGRFVPEFSRAGKEPITLRHLLTHTGGFRSVSSNSSPEPWDKIIAEICAARIEPGWVPGEKAGYHIASSWYILAEVVRRIDGRMIDQFAREEIFLPLKMTDCWIGVPPEAFAAYGDRMVSTYSTEKHAPDPSHPPLTPEFAALVRPAGNARGPMRQLGRFYQMLHHHGQLDGVRLLTPQTVEAMTARHRTRMMDHTFKHIIDFGLGFLINSAQYGVDTVPYGYGQSASPRTFGHSGNQTSCAFCDPTRGLVVAWVCNGTPGEPRHQKRQREINNAIYEDVFGK